MGCVMWNGFCFCAKVVILIVFVELLLCCFGWRIGKRKERIVSVLEMFWMVTREDLRIKG